MCKRKFLCRIFVRIKYEYQIIRIYLCIFVILVFLKYFLLMCAFLISKNKYIPRRVNLKSGAWVCF